MVNDNVSNRRFTPKYVTYPEESSAFNKLLHDLSCFHSTKHRLFNLEQDKILFDNVHLFGKVSNFFTSMNQQFDKQNA